MIGAQHIANDQLNLSPQGLFATEHMNASLHRRTSKQNGILMVPAL